MQPFQCDQQPQLQETHRTTHTRTSTCCKTHRRNQSRPERPQPQPPHRRGTFHRRLQPLYTEKHKVSCSSFPSSPLPFVTTPLHHHFPSSPLPFVTTSHRHHFPSSPLPFVTTSLRHHPSLSPPFIKVNSTASYSFVMYCYVIYHPASFQVAEFYLSVTRKYCFPTSFDKLHNAQMHVCTVCIYVL